MNGSTLALQGIGGSPMAVALQGFAASAIRPESSGGRRRRGPWAPAPAVWWPQPAPRDERDDIEALLIAGAL